jgi:anti-sigma factor RsiW
MRGEPVMNCADLRIALRDYQAGRLPAAAEGDVHAHLESCPDCTHADTVERELTSVLEHRLPQYPASLALKRQLAARWQPSIATRPRWNRWRPWLAPAFALMALALVAMPALYYERAASRDASVSAGMIREAVTNHLRVLSSQRPLEIESSGIHQVKPWFEGRLDFAPVVPFEGDADFPLRGGAVGYFLDRKAAVFVYSHRLHPISLFVFRADGLPWPTKDGSALSAAERGFNLVMWRRSALGYALVSDVDRRDLASLAARLQATP